MNYSSKPYDGFTIETWALDSGYKVQLLSHQGGHSSLVIFDQYGSIVIQRRYEYHQHGQAQHDADELARMGSAGVAVAA